MQKNTETISISGRKKGTQIKKEESRVEQKTSKNHGSGKIDINLYLYSLQKCAKAELVSIYSTIYVFGFRKVKQNKAKKEQESERIFMRPK